MSNFLFFDFNFLSNFQLDCTIFTILDYITTFNINYLTGFILLSIVITISLPIYLGSFRAGYKRIWDGTKWVWVATSSGVAGAAGSDIYKEIKDKVKSSGNKGSNSNKGNTGNSGGSSGTTGSSSTK